MTVRPEELVQTLMQRARDARRADQARADSLRHALREMLPGLARGRGWTRAWLIGSLSADTFGAGSDVDIVVEGMRLADQPRIWDALSLGLRAQVDLLRFEELEPSFQRRVVEEGHPLDVT